jgi:hypothetical protein
VTLAGRGHHDTGEAMKYANGERKFTAVLQIGRPSGMREGVISIQIEDVASGCRILELDVPLADFAAALTGRYLNDVPGTYWPAPVGARAEIKREVVPFDSSGVPYAAERDGRYAHPAVDAALAPFEVDGWKGDRSDLFNGHRHAGDKLQKVKFRRLVDPATDKPL